MWVRFINTFNWRPRPGVIQAFTPGTEASVTHDCGEQAVAGGYAVKLKAPRRGEKKQAVKETPTEEAKADGTDG